MEFEFNSSEWKEYLRIIEQLYTFVMCSMDSYMIPHDYGEGRVLSMIEMHTLGMIAEKPGICITDVAKMWNRTLGAASKNVNKLQKKGYIEKKKLPGNNKNIHLYPTREGQYLAELHKKYDKEENKKTLQELMGRHSKEELSDFKAVLESLIELQKRAL
ncbi:MAG: MarR family transcriptional regulator [Lachnospiraceae bacterium]